MPPPPMPEPQGNAVGLILKITLALSLVALVASVPRLFRKKPAEEVQPAMAGQTVLEPEENPQPVTPRRQFAPRESAQPRPVQARQAAAANPSPERATSNLWASVAAPPVAGGYLMASRLPELQVGMDGVLSRFESPVFYRVPPKYGEELSNSLAEIRAATNVLKQFDFEFRTLFASAERDHQDYVRTAKAAHAQRRAEAAGLTRKRTDMQALYLERKRDFQQESVRVKPQLQDSPQDFDKKLVLYQKTTDAYEKDINQLEAAIYSLTKQIQATGEWLREQEGNIESAYELSAQDVKGQLKAWSDRLNGKLGEVNAAIRDYNSSLGRYGSPLHVP